MLPRPDGRLYVKAVFTGFKRGMRNPTEHTSILKLDGVFNKKDAKWYAGRRCVFLFKAHNKKTIPGKSPRRVRAIWGNITRPHGNTGSVRAKSHHNLPAVVLGSYGQSQNVCTLQADRLKTVRRFAIDAWNITRRWAELAGSAAASMDSLATARIAAKFRTPPYDALSTGSVLLSIYDVRLDLQPLPIAESAPEVNLAASPLVSQNPGTFEELHKRAQDVFPMCFEGARVMVQKGLSSHFQVAHTITLSSINTGYKLGATYVGAQKMGEGEAYPILLGDTNAAGNTTATIVHQFTIRWKAKLQGQVQKSTIAGAQASLERRSGTADWKATLGSRADSREEEDV